GGEVKTVQLGRDEIPCLDCGDTIIIGGSIYAGKIQKSVKKFISNNLKTLVEKKIGLFVCAAEKQDPRKTEQLNNAFSQKIRQRAVSIECFGDEIYWEKLNPFYKFIVKLISKKTGSHSNIDYNAIDRMAETLRKS
ncbi:flavodoxin, partial [bacterium]|nr:flavodoxin [bacterium]